MTQEQKAKAYDEAIERAKEMIKAMTNIGGVAKVDDIQYLFPELKESEESEDENVRKEIISHLQYLAKYCNESMPNVDKWIAWLEKQGEQNDILEDAILDSNEDGLIAETIIYKNETQGEKKPADVEEVNFFEDFRKTDSEVEPKFHEGDWTVSNLDGKARQISEVHFDEYNGYYVVNGQSVNLEEYDRLHHLWTIQDAKDGDVLATEPIEGFHSPFVAIYKKQNEEDFGSYCFIGFDGKFYKGEDDHSTEEVHPATKEQRDTLFAKMKEEGYEWDAEKKKLKIEQSPIDVRTASYCHVKDVEQNPAWSEKDELMLVSIIQTLKLTNGSAQMKIDWLKSIKERILPKSTWSEEDERMYTRLHNLIYSTPYCDSRKELSDFLNSLKNKLQSNLQP